MQFGTLEFKPVDRHGNLVAASTRRAIEQYGLSDVWVSEIDPELADTAAFCERYNISQGTSANCVIVEAKRGDNTWYAACVILATTKADINGVVRKQIGARRVSFAPMELTISMTEMEYGGITPIGLPADWPILVDSRVVETARVIIGGGVRGSKLLVPGILLATLPNALVIDMVKPLQA